MTNEIKEIQRLAGIKSSSIVTEESIKDRLGLKTVVTRKINVPDFDASDWDIYDKPGANRVAAILNRALERLVNSGLPPDGVYKNMSDIMYKYSEEYGALDSESRYFLKTILRAIYGDEFED